MNKNEIDKEIKNVSILSEVVALPSKGYLYNNEHPLHSGQIVLKFPTAAEEDILTSKNLLQKGLTIEKFLEAIILTPGVRLDDLFIGDENAIMYSSRILAYGPEYEVEYNCQNCGHKSNVTIDLDKLNNTEIDDALFQNGNEFIFTLPKSKEVIKFKLLTHRDEQDIQQTAKNISKYDKKSDHIGTTRLKKSIIAIDDITDRSTINSKIDTMLAIDSSKLKKYISDISPDVITKFKFECENCSYDKEVQIPLGVSFFWPNSEL